MSKTKEAVVEQVSKTTEAVVEFVTPIFDSITEIVDPEGTAKRIEARKEAAAKKRENTAKTDPISENALVAESAPSESGKSVPETEQNAGTESDSENVQNPESVTVSETAEEINYIEETSQTEHTETSEIGEGSEIAENNSGNAESGRKVTKSSSRKDMAIQFSDGHTWKRVSVNKAENKPEKTKKSAAKITKRKSLRDYNSFRQGKPQKRKYPYDAPKDSRNISLIQAVYEDDLKKKRFYVPLGRFNNFRDAYLFWLAHPEYPAVIVRVGYSEFEVRAGDYSEEEYKFLKSLITRV